MCNSRDQQLKDKMVDTKWESENRKMQNMKLFPSRGAGAEGVVLEDA